MGNTEQLPAAARALFRAAVVLTLAGLAYGGLAVFPLWARPLPQVLVMFSKHAADQLQVAHGQGTGIRKQSVAADGNGQFVLDLGAHPPVRLRIAEGGIAIARDGESGARLVAVPGDWKEPGQDATLVPSNHMAAVMTFVPPRGHRLAARVGAALVGLLALLWFRTAGYRRREAASAAFLGRFSRWDLLLAATAGLIFVTHPVGVDLPTFRHVIELQHGGINPTSSRCSWKR